MGGGFWYGTHYTWTAFVENLLTVQPMNIPRQKYVQILAHRGILTVQVIGVDISPIQPY